jgi:hypothetical protein
MAGAYPLDARAAAAAGALARHFRRMSSIDMGLRRPYPARLFTRRWT